MASVSILISGDCGGKLSALFKRVASVNKSNGPFAALLCVGGFFEPSGVEGDSSEDGCELTEFIAQHKQAPIPTYFIGSFGKSSEMALEALSAADCGIHYLGRSGVTEIAGLTVAFLDGIFDAEEFSADELDTEAAGCRYFREMDVAKLKLEVDGAGDIDIFLTCQWPAGILAYVPPALLPKGMETNRSPKNGVKLLDELAALIRPRYHIASGEGVYYARVPYQNPDRGVGGHVTRFIGLAAVGNKEKEKSLHALKLCPMARMDLDAVMAKPPDTTPCPFTSAKKVEVAAKRPSEGDLDGQEWRWQQGGKKQRPVGKPIPGRPGVVKDPAVTIYAKNLPFAASEVDIENFFAKAGKIVDIRRPADEKGRPVGHCFVQFETVEDTENALQMNGQVLMGRPITISMATPKSSGPPVPTGKPVDTCWFCLSNPNCAIWLICSVGQEIYLTLDKAPMHPQHCLLIPIEHFPSSLSLSSSAFREAHTYIEAVRKCYATRGCQLVGFERFMRLRRMGGNHCHINMVPVNSGPATTAQAVFQDSAEQQGFKLRHLPFVNGVEEARQQLLDVVGESEYFLAHLPDGSRLVTTIEREQRHPMDFGRKVLAQLLGTPDKAHPKECALSQSEEEQLGEELKAAFKPYDPMG